MSLKDAVLAIATDMEEQAKEIDENGESVIFCAREVLQFAKSIRFAVMASGDGQSFSIAEMMKKQNNLPVAPPLPSIPSDQFRDIMVEVVDGVEGSTFTSMPADMPVGAKTMISGKVFQFKEDRKLHPVQ